MAGTIAGIARTPIGGCTPSAYSFRFKTRPLFYDSVRSKFAEVITGTVFCEFNDSKSYALALWSDGKRYVSRVAYETNETVINGLSAAGRPYFRKFVDMIPAPGTIGCFFQIEIDKAIHNVNGFKYTGLSLNTVSRPGISQEFLAGGSTLETGW